MNDIFFNQNTAGKLDERAAQFIEKIDDSKLLSKYKIRSRFDDITLNIDRLSTGCKTVLNVFYYPDKVFCLKECGNNALEVLYRFEEGFVYSEYAMIPFDMERVEVQTSGGKKVIDNADILLNDDTRRYISQDDENQYLLIGRNPKNLFATKENLFELVSEKAGEQTEFTFQPYM